MGYKYFTLDKREILQRLLEQGRSVRDCARILGYSPSAVSLEISKGSKKIHGGRRYDPWHAHHRACRLRRRASRKGKSFDQAVLEYVRRGLMMYWSPEQISHRMRLDFPHDKRMRISFKTIYRWLHKGRNSHRPHPWQGYFRYLRLKRPGKVFTRGVREMRGRRHDLPSIEDRPRQAAERGRFGDWEGDLMQGFRRQGYLVTLVERSLGLLMARPCPDKSPDSANKAILAAFENFPRKYIRTITVDRGKEFYGYEQLQEKLQTFVYFCHPHCPNERGQNEQANGLLRQFFPKRKPLSGVGNEQIQWAVALINNRPKKKFGFRTTMELIAQRGLKEVLSFT